MKLLNFVLGKLKKHRLNQANAGFTLVEILVVVVIVGVLAAISVYSLQSWVNRVRVNGVQDKVLNAMREAQTQARQRATSWQASFRQVQETGGEKVMYVAIHPVETSTTAGSSSFATNDPDYWKSIDEPGVEIDTNRSFTTAFGVSNFTVGSTTGPAWRVRFDSKGNVIPEQNQNLPARITLSFKGTMPKRCVEVVTLLGSMRSEGDGKCDDN